MTANFVVYEHWRPDTDACFYVGKGKAKRSRSFEARNNLYGRIVAKLQRGGVSPEIRIVGDGLTEAEAFCLEIERIAYWRLIGVKIANFTDGGDGTSGRLHSDATKAKIRKKAIGRKISPGTIEKMIRSRTGQKRTDETRKRQSDSAKIAQRKRFDKLQSTAKGRASIKASATRMSRIAASDPAVCKKRSENTKALWSDPSYRAKVMAARCVPKPVVKGFS